LQWFEEREEQPYFTNAKQGTGIKAILDAAQLVGKQINQRRRDRGMLPRPVRAVVIGFPNVGKSALINRLVKRKAVASARRAGVTKQLQWVRISDEIELLDAPGVIPLKLENQEDAVKLAICEDIGEAAYDNQRVAAAMVDLLVSLNYGEILQSRYQLDPFTITGEEFVYNLGGDRYLGDTERSARQLLNDFRTGLMGKIALEIPG
jgi:ribosome biogenesis GTPase A